MTSPADLLFLLGVTFLMVHELDAIRQGEHRFFLAWLNVSDTVRCQIFMAAHVPLFVLVLANLASSGFQLGMDFFLIGHAVAHTILRDHPHIRFNDTFSRIWIFGGAVLGLAHAAMLLTM
jgi:hypothetical protein